MDYPFIVQAWIYQGDYRPSPPHPPFLPSIPGVAQCCTLPLHRRVPPTPRHPSLGTGMHLPPCSSILSTPGAVTPLLKMTKAGPGVMQKSVSPRSWMGAEFLGDGGISPQMSQPPFFLPLLCLARCCFLNRDNDNSNWHPASVFLPYWSDSAVLMACHSQYPAHFHWVPRSVGRLWLHPG